MSGLGKPVAGWEAGSASERCYRADMFLEPEAGWPVPQAAIFEERPYNKHIVNRIFPANKETGVGFCVRMPDKAALMQTRLMSSIASKSRVGVCPRLFVRPPGKTWRGPIALGVLWFEEGGEQDYTQALTVPSLGIESGSYVEFEVARSPGSRGDTHKGDWVLHWVGLNFA